MKKYILAVDQSTQGTKGLLFDGEGNLTARADRPHRQIVNDMGWVEHDPLEIMQNVLGVCRDVITKAGIDPAGILAFAISNQRETSIAWNKNTGEPVCNAIVWQCARAKEICRVHEEAGEAQTIKNKTGLNLSPYFPASKMQWIMENVPEAERLAEKGELAFGTVDSWLVYHLTGKKVHRTDYSNASRTQLFNLRTLQWDPELLKSFKIPESALPEVVMSDSVFGMTSLLGILPKEVPITGVLGDSHGALFGQNCRRSGEIKATYGTGSSVMMNTGEIMYESKDIVTSLAWGMNGKVEYVLEGNLNYTGAVITWLKDQVCLIDGPWETGSLAAQANPEDRSYFVPAFTGLGAPYWDADATGMLTGVTRTTGKNEIVKACLESISYQITDLVELMRKETGKSVPELHVDGGPTGNEYLMQFQSDMANTVVNIPELPELSGMGAAYAAGIAVGLYHPDMIFNHIRHTYYKPKMDQGLRKKKYDGWKEAIERVLYKTDR
ncbi:MAG: FGGY family carbohydrate kinase [Bilifractor sp.]